MTIVSMLGASAVQAVRAVRAAGMRVLGASCVVDHEQGVQEVLAKEGCEFESLYTMAELFSGCCKGHAMKRESIDPELDPVGERASETMLLRAELAEWRQGIKCRGGLPPPGVQRLNRENWTHEERSSLIMGERSLILHGKWDDGCVDTALRKYVRRGECGS